MRPLLIALALVLLFGGCGGAGQRGPSPDARPARIISLSPNTTEILYGIGAWPQVVAVSQYCTYPDDVKNKPRVGGWADTNLEQVVALKPNLIIGVDAQSAFLHDKLDGLGLRSIFVKSQSLDDVFASISEIGRASGHEDEAKKLLADTRSEIDAVRTAVANRPRPRVLCVVDRLPGTIRDLYTATRGSYLDNLIDIAGGEPIAPQADIGYGKIEKEAVLSLNPEIIIDMVVGSKSTAGEDPVQVWNELPEIKAVREKRIYPIRDPTVIHPSQFVGHTASTFARLIHPEAFPNQQ
jgi:iron complex transport system substrate-binding protein